LSILSPEEKKKSSQIVTKRRKKNGCSYGDRGGEKALCHSYSILENGKEGRYPRRPATAVPPFTLVKTKQTQPKKKHPHP